MPSWVGDRRVFVNTRGTQTVKVCTAQNQRGLYERYYRIDPPCVLPQDQMESTIAQFTSLVDLDSWLTRDRKAARESENEVGPSFVVARTSANGGEREYVDNLDSEEAVSMSGLSEDSNPVAEVLNLLRCNAYSPDQDAWLPAAKDIVERVIDRLLTEFLQSPYLHRVEHSMHAHLYQMLVAEEVLAERIPIGARLADAQLVHKEWPETIARQGNRRGNFDLAVLSPTLLKGCASIKTFREGRLVAPIVIEMGLDYDAEHLAGDAKKLINSRPKYGYLLHLVREQPRSGDAEEIILGMESKFGIKTAYACTAGRQQAYKLLGDGSITEKTSDSIS
jgi:hypothetical protein